MTFAYPVLPRAWRGPHVRTVSFDRGPVAVVGDIHGRADLLRPLLARLGPTTPVLVLGDSFLRIYQRDEPGSAGFVSHLARELKMPLSSIINDGGGSTLVRQELYRKPDLLKGKKVVVWEFTERDIRFGVEGWQNVPLPQ
jgi:hypothetical protein